MIRAILRAQLLSLRGMGMRHGAAGWVAMIPVVLFYGLWTGMAFGAYFLCRHMTDPARLAPSLAGGLLGVFLYWQITPVITVSMGASLDLQKLIVYPINLDKLFLVEVMLRFLTVGEMLLVLAGGMLGMLRNPVFGGWSVLPRILPATLAFIVFNLLISAGVRSLIENLMKRKRFREVFMAVFVLVCVTPGMVIATRPRLTHILPYLPLTGFWPWAAEAQLWMGNGDLLKSSGALAFWIFVVYRFGRRQFYRSLRSDPFAGRQPRKQKPGTMAWAEAIFRFPGRIWRDPLGALIEKDLRSLSRSSGFRLAFFMGFTFGLLIFLPQVIVEKRNTSFMREHFLAWVSIYSLLLVGYYTFWNCFGFDRSAAQFYFAAPVSFRVVITAKNITASLFQFVELTLITLVFLALPLPISAFTIGEAFAVTAVCCLYVFAIGNLTSVRFPNPMDPDKMSRGTSGRAANTLVMLLFPIAFLPVGLAYWGRYVFHSDPIFFLILGAGGLIGAIFYWVATDSAVHLTLRRREEMIATLSKGSGPLSIT
jgi:ABC-2 type transport system permease protein